MQTYLSRFYDLNFTLDEIRPTYQFEVSCQKSVPQAINAFLEADSFEDTIKTAISIGGDSDTIAAIAGSLAEACYPIPSDLEQRAFQKLTPTLIWVIPPNRNNHPQLQAKSIEQVSAANISLAVDFFTPYRSPLTQLF